MLVYCNLFPEIVYIPACAAAFWNEDIRCKGFQERHRHNFRHAGKKLEKEKTFVSECKRL